MVTIFNVLSWNVGRGSALKSGIFIYIAIHYPIDIQIIRGLFLCIIAVLNL